MAQASKNKPELERERAPGGLVGNHQESEREKPDPDDEGCERAPGSLVGNFQEGQPGCDDRKQPERR